MKIPIFRMFHENSPESDDASWNFVKMIKSCHNRMSKILHSGSSVYGYSEHLLFLYKGRRTSQKTSIPMKSDRLSIVGHKSDGEKS